MGGDLVLDLVRDLDLKGGDDLLRGGGENDLEWPLLGFLLIGGGLGVRDFRLLLIFRTGDLDRLLCRIFLGGEADHLR